MAEKVTKIKVRRHVSSARGTPIDGYLDDRDIEKLYDKWDDSWGVPFRFRGGIESITAEIIMGAPISEMKKVYGKAFTDRITKVASEQASSY